MNWKRIFFFGILTLGFAAPESTTTREGCTGLLKSRP